MLKNNIEIDVKVKCIEAATTQAKLAEEVGTTPSYVNRLIKKKDGIVNNTFLQMLEKLGYDVELTYVKRENIRRGGYSDARQKYKSVSDGW